MLRPITYSINNDGKIPLYALKDIIKYESDKIEEWLTRTDIVIIDFDKLELGNENISELTLLENLLNDIDTLEEQFKLK